MRWTRRSLIWSPAVLRRRGRSTCSPWSSVPIPTRLSDNRLSMISEMLAAYKGARARHGRRPGTGDVLRRRRVPHRVGGRPARAVLGPRRPAYPEPGVADVCRHRRLVAQVRLHVPPLRHALRLGLDRQGHQRLRLHRRHPGPARVVRRGQRITPAPPPPRAPPAQPGLSAEASEYGGRYTPRVPLDPKDPDELGHYMGWTLPYYAEHFLDWWRGRLRPEMERNFVRFHEVDYEQASLVELAILLEDAIDMHDRHWQIHWVLNFAQFSSTLALNGAITAAKGDGDHGALMGRLQSSTENRNWD